MAVRYVSSYTATLEDDEGGRLATLLWGDPLHVQSTSGSRTKVLARGWPGWVNNGDISDRNLLEIYVIDVGQGDGVLVKTPTPGLPETPAGNWLLIDAGKPLARQMTKKGAANFLRWKFIRDLRLDKVVLESIIVSHPDADHFGGVIDLLRGKLWEGTTFDVEVGTLYHSGFARFAATPELGDSQKGEVASFPLGYQGVQRRGTFHTELLEGRDTFANPPRPFAELFAEYAEVVAAVPSDVRRLSRDIGHLPGYAPGESEVTITILGPILENFAPQKRGLRLLDGDAGKTLNGHSIVLRLEYGDVRILLTGDLNERSMRLLRSYLPDEEFAVDVAKACHHGAEDVDLDFVAAMQARATVVSSGDSEGYAHPRPVLLGASAWYGRESDDALKKHRLPPLVYSTELARSVRLGYAFDVRTEATNTFAPPEQFQVKTKEKTKRYEPLERVPLSTDLVYGLVNVRTDGETILCATMLEEGNAFDVKVIRAPAT